MTAQKNIYEEVKIFEYPNMVIHVHTPILSDEEKKRNMKQLLKATEALLKTYKKGSKNILH